jgi:hypothetical protein
MPGSLCARLVLFVTLSLTVSSCGDSGGGAGSAPAKCNALVDKTCVKLVSCINDGTTQSECVGDVNASLPCAEAGAVSATYPSCMSDLDATSCATLTANDTLNLPATCNAVILFQR